MEGNLNRPGSLMMRTSMFLSDREISYLEIEKREYLYAICHLYHLGRMEFGVANVFGRRWKLQGK